MRLYEGMFLFDNAFAHEWSAVDAEVRRLAQRIEAELLVCLKYDERRLAYEISGRKRGTYVLTYFKVNPERIRDIERDVQLSESILRAMFVRADSVTDEQIAELAARPPEQPLSPGGGERERRGEDGGGRWGDRGPRGDDGGGRWSDRGPRGRDSEGGGGRYGDRGPRPRTDDSASDGADGGDASDSD